MRSDCNRAIASKGQICHLFGDRENVGEFPRGRENTKIVGKLEKLFEDRGKFRGTGFQNYSRYTTRSTRFGSVELKKGFPDFVCRECNRGHCDGGCGVERRLGLLVIKTGIGSRG